MLTAENRDETPVRELIETLAAAFGVEASGRLVGAYAMAFADLDVAAVERGVRLAVSQCESLPTAVEVRRLAGVLSAHEVASAAWRDLYEAIGRHGRYASVDFEDRVVNAVVRRLGGWQHLCALRAKDLRQRVRGEFLREYVALSKSGATEDEQRHLVGVHGKAPVVVKARCSPKALKPVQLQLKVIAGEGGK